MTPQKEKPKTLETINKEAIEIISVASPILDKIIKNPQLANFHDPTLSKIRDSRWSGHYVCDSLDEIMRLYSAECYNDITNSKEIPNEVKKFVRQSYNYKFGVN